MVLYPGLDPQAVSKRHVRYATGLMESGYNFDLMAAKQRPEVEKLVDAALPGGSFTFNPQDTGFVATNADVGLAGCLVVCALEFDTKVTLFVRGLVVAQEHQHRGLGTVLLGLAPQLLWSANYVGEAELVTQVPARLATFFHRAGYVIEEPGASVPPELVAAGLKYLPLWGAEPSWAHATVRSPNQAG